MESPAVAAELAANHNGEIISIAVIFTLLSSLALAARLTSRYIAAAKYGADDALLVAAWVLATAETISTAAATRFAKLGYHIEALSTDDVVALEKLLYATSFLQTTTLALAKLSLLILLHRIFIVRPFRITVFVLAGIVLAWWTATFFAGAFICYPASHLWDPRTSAACGNGVLLNVISPIPWVVTDFAILIAPMPVIKQLQLTKARKFGVYAAFLLGGMLVLPSIVIEPAYFGRTCIISVIRYAELVSVTTSDPSWSITGLACLQIVEAHVSIVCAAIVAAKPVLKIVIPERFRSQLWSRLSSSSNKAHKLSSGSDSSRQRGLDSSVHSQEKSIRKERIGPPVMVGGTSPHTVETSIPRTAARSIPIMVEEPTLHTAESSIPIVVEETPLHTAETSIPIVVEGPTLHVAERFVPGVAELP